MGTKFCHEKLVIVAATVKFHDSSLHLFDRAQGCDRRTDGRTELRWLRCAKAVELLSLVKINL